MLYDFLSQRGKLIFIPPSPKLLSRPPQNRLWLTVFIPPCPKPVHAETTSCLPCAPSTRGSFRYPQSPLLPSCLAHLTHDGERDPELSVRKAGDLLPGAGLLRAELVAREGHDRQLVLAKGEREQRWRRRWVSCTRGRSWGRRTRRRKRRRKTNQRFDSSPSPLKSES